MSADSTSLIGGELTSDFTDPQCSLTCSPEVDLQPLTSFADSTATTALLLDRKSSAEMQWLNGDTKTRLGQKSTNTSSSSSSGDSWSRATTTAGSHHQQQRQQQQQNANGGKMKPIAVPPNSTTIRRARIYRCRICKKEFPSKSEMQRHARGQHSADELTKRHRCTRCFKTFSTSPQLTQHWLVHNNVRRFVCVYCNKAFKQLSHVQQHQRIHTGERPYKCLDSCCNKSFRQLSSLQQHLKSHNMTSSTRIQDGSNANSHSQTELSTKKQKQYRSGCTSKIVRPSDLQCHVCGINCADDGRFFRHVHRHHPEYWRVLAGSRPLSDFIDIYTVNMDSSNSSAAAAAAAAATVGVGSGGFICRRQQHVFNSLYNGTSMKMVEGQVRWCVEVDSSVEIGEHAGKYIRPVFHDCFFLLCSLCTTSSNSQQSTDLANQTSSIDCNCLACNQVLNGVKTSSVSDHVNSVNQYRQSTIGCPTTSPSYGGYSLFGSSVFDCKPGIDETTKLTNHATAAAMDAGNLSQSHCMFSDGTPFNSARPPTAGYLGNCADSYLSLPPPPPPSALYRTDLFFRRSSPSSASFTSPDVARHHMYGGTSADSLFSPGSAISTAVNTYL